MRTATPSRLDLFTIGHSNHELDRFLELLAQHRISALADVRSEPYSRYSPQFSRDALEPALKSRGVQYVFLGRELGARRSEPECYRDGVARYALIARSPSFKQGLTRVREGLRQFRLALMCAEKDPLTCHRAILVCRAMRGPDVAITHVLEDGALESMHDFESRLLREFHLDEPDLFRSDEQRLEEAYDRQAERIQYALPADAGTAGAS